MGTKLKLWTATGWGPVASIYIHLDSIFNSILMLALTLKRSELTNSRNLRCKTPLNFRVASGNVRVQTNYSLRVAKEKHNIFISYRGNTKFVVVT